MVMTTFVSSKRDSPKSIICVQSHNQITKKQEAQRRMRFVRF